jgi:hypothetical protein
LKTLYDKAFGERLTVKIAMAPSDKAVWKIAKVVA